MTRRITLKVRNLSASLLFLAVVTALIAFAAPSQHAVSVATKPAYASTPGQALLRPLLQRVDGTQAISSSGLSGKESSFVAPDSGIVSFLPAVTYGTGGANVGFFNNSAWVSVVDLNGDGKPDVLVANWCSSYVLNACPDNANVGVLLGNGDGTFRPVVTYGSGSFWAFSVLTADVNGDGKLDLLVLNGCPAADSFLGSICPANSSVGVLLGNGDGTFQAVENYDSGGETSWMAIADVNRDGKPDLLVANQDGGNDGESSVGVLLGIGDGTFQPVQSYSSGGMQADFIAVADLNGDRKPDLLVSNLSSGNDFTGSVGVLLGNGDGTFQPVVTYSPIVGANVLAVADLNRDRKLDLVVNGGGPFNGGALSVLLGNGDGTFQPPVTYSSGGSYNEAPILIDLNRDNKLDLVMAIGACNSHGDGCVGVLLGNGDGTFQPSVLYTTGVGTASVAAGDVNGDGKADLLVAGGCGPKTCLSGDGLVYVLLGYGDGTFQPAISYDPGGESTNWIGRADVNGDGKLDVLAVNANKTTTDGSVGVLINNTPVLTLTKTVLVTSPNPSVFDQGVDLTAAVTSSSGVPTGTVIFLDGAAPLGSATLVNGSASISSSALATGSHMLTAAYQGDGDFNLSKSAHLNQVVNMASTTTSLVSSPNPVVVNGSVKYTAAVTSQYGGAATGMVVFQDGGTMVATVSVSGNKATYSTSYNATGAHAITAAYSGDLNNTASTSATLTENVDGLKSTVAVTTSGSPSLLGQPVTFTASVTSTYGSIPNGELVTFYDGTTLIGSAATASGLATFTTSSLTAKTHTIEATYAGDSTFETSSGTVKQVVSPDPTSTALASSLNPAIYGQSVTWTATVITTGSILPTGNVQFNFGSSSTLAALNASGVATLTQSNVNVGAYAMTAVYKGDANNAGSTSAILNQAVQQATTSATLTSSPNPSTEGKTVTFSAIITSPTLTPTGAVTFMVGNTVLGTANLDIGKANFKISTLLVGSTTVTATYAGDANIAGSSASVTQIVQQ